MSQSLVYLVTFSIGGGGGGGSLVMVSWKVTTGNAENYGGNHSDEKGAGPIAETSSLHFFCGDYVQYRKSRGLRIGSRQISFEFLSIKTRPPDKINYRFRCRMARRIQIGDAAVQCLTMYPYSQCRPLSRFRINKHSTL